MKKRFMIRIISFCLAAVLVSIGFSIKTMQENRRFRLELENSYSRNLDDFSAARSALDSIKADPMSGWLSVPTDANELAQIYQAANKIKSDSACINGR